MKDFFDKVFEYITYLAYLIADSKYIEEIGISHVNPYLLLIIVASIIYFILEFLYKIYKKHRFISQRREEIQNIKWRKEIEKQEELNELKKRNKEAREIAKLLGEYDRPRGGIGGLSIEDIGSLILKQNEELERVKQEKEDIKNVMSDMGSLISKQTKELEKVKKEKPQVVVKEVIKEVKPKEEKPKTEVKIVPKVKEINVTIPKIKINMPEPEPEEPEPIVESVLSKDITTTDNDRVEISADYQDNIEEKVEQLEHKEEKEGPIKDNFDETIPIETPGEEEVEEPVKEEVVEEDNPLEVLKRKNMERRKHLEQIKEEIDNRA